MQRQAIFICRESGGTHLACCATASAAAGSGWARLDLGRRVYMLCMLVCMSALRVCMPTESLGRQLCAYLRYLFSLGYILFN